MTGKGNNTYLIAARGGSATLIDAGVGDARHIAELSAALESSQSRLDTVLVTHGHPDHAAGAAALVSAFHTSCAKRPWPGQDEQFAVPWRIVAEGDLLQAGDETLRVLHTPGHSPDHLAFWHEPTRTILTGDLVVAGSSVMIHTSKGGDLAQYLQSLERLRALAPRLLLPAHGSAIDDPDALLNGYLEHRRLRERQVVGALEAGHRTVEAVTESIYHGLDATLMAAARENVRAHLAKLQADGVAVEDEPGRWRL